jgi:hypothetical protein
MGTRTQDARAVEHGLRALEKLLEGGDRLDAEVALDLIGPGVEALGDELQLERLLAARARLEGPTEVAPARP